MVQKGISAIIVVLVGLLGIAGCGSDSSLSKSEYEQKLELVCKKLGCVQHHRSAARRGSPLGCAVHPPVVVPSEERDAPQDR